jgi:hypothetical protein
MRSIPKVLTYFRLIKQNNAVFDQMIGKDSRRAYSLRSKVLSDKPPLDDDQVIYEIPVVYDTAGVFRPSEADDIKLLVNNFTAPALAMALRNRETALQQAAILVRKGEFDKLRKLLEPFQTENVTRRRIRNHGLNFAKELTKKELVVIQRYMHRLPRHLYQPAPSRASVLIPLCNDKGVASILFQRRSEKVRFKNQICFPGGMLDETSDISIVNTSLRETEEELGLPLNKVEVLGVLRCNWQEVALVTGILPSYNMSKAFYCFS